MKRKTMLTRMNILVYPYEYTPLTHGRLLYMGMTPSLPLLSIIGISLLYTITAQKFENKCEM